MAKKGIFNTPAPAETENDLSFVGTGYLDFERISKDLALKIVEQNEKILDLKKQLKIEKDYLDDLNDKLVKVAELGHEYSSKHEPLFQGVEE